MHVRVMIRAALFAALALCSAAPAQAQGALQAIVVPTCGAKALPPNEPAALFMDQSGNLCAGGAGGTTTSSGAIQPPTAAAGKITQTIVTLSANASTQLVAARATSGDRIAVEVQCDGTAAVGIDRTGGTLTSATAAPLVIPSGSYPLYTMPIATQTAITAYTGTGQSCRVTEYLR